MALRRAALQHGRRNEELQLASAWLQHLLRSSSVSTGSSGWQQQQQQRSDTAPAGGERAGSSSRQQGSMQQQAQGTAAGSSSSSDGQVTPAPHWRSAGRYTFSVRPSVLSPLHALHREAQEVEQRLALLGATLTAHVKLSDVLTDAELDAASSSAARPAASSDDAVADALAARGAKLQEVLAAYNNALRSSLAPPAAPRDAVGYFALLEHLASTREPGAAPFEAVLQGERSVWDYYFTAWAPQYAGLPSLGRLEAIYNQQSEAALLREKMAELRASAPKPPPQPVVDQLGRARAKGGRKTSSAQVLVWRGQGRILVNGQALERYFGDLLMRSHLLKPLSVTGLMGQVDVAVQVHGGGVSGQAQAAAHGLAKALKRLDPGLRPALKAAGLLKRDPRMVERKKPGKAKARKSFAWVKR